MVRTYEKAEKQISEISVWKTKQLETEIVKIVLHTHIHCVFRDFLAVKALLPSWPLSFPRSKDAKDSWIVLQRFSQNSEFLTNVLASLRAVFGALFKLLAPSKNLHKGGTATLTPPPPASTTLSPIRVLSQYPPRLSESEFSSHPIRLCSHWWNKSTSNPVGVR